MLNTLLVAGLVLFVVFRVRYVAQAQQASEAMHLPRNLVKFVTSHPLPEFTLNYYNWGGYMIWTLYPNYHVFIDGRADLYGDHFLNQYAHAYYLTNDWPELLDKFHVEAVVLPPDAPLITGLEGLRHWKVLYADEQAKLIVKQ